MIKTFCDNVVGIYTRCESVVAVYTNCELVWEQGPVPPGMWYVSWAPSDISGYFYMFGQSYRAEDYSGLYTWSGSDSGYITGGFTTLDSISYIETNVKFISEYAFDNMDNLRVVSMSKCLDLDSGAFEDNYNLSYVYMPRVSHISFLAFGGCSTLTSIYAPRCINIDHAAFEQCDLLTLDLPACKEISVEAFRGNYHLSQVSLPVCERIWDNAFDYCHSLEEIYLPACTSFAGIHHCNALSRADLPVAGTAGFTDCPSLVYVSAPMAKAACFSGCTSLSYVNLSECEKLYGYSSGQTGAFDGCTNLLSIEVPNLKSMDAFTFRNCTQLSYADLGTVSAISSSTFYNCTNLSTLIFRSTSMVFLGIDIQNFQSSNIDPIFHNTPFMNCEGSIYVPTYLYSTYLNDSRWSHLSCVLKSMFMPIPSGSYYVSWTPTNISGSFKIDGYTQYYRDYTDGVVWFVGGVIESSAFSSGKFSTFETNAYRFESSAFRNCTLLKSLSAPYCEYVGYACFSGCSVLRTISLPACTSLYNDAFRNCYASKIDLPVCVSAPDGAFSDVSTLISVNLPVLSYLDESTFMNCGKLSDVSLPLCEYVAYRAFSGCSKLSVIDLPMCKDIDMYAFEGCSSLSSISLPLCEAIGFSCFRGCYSLTSIDLPVCTVLGDSVFTSRLQTIILRASEVCELVGNLTVGSFTGSIYVPSSLYSRYRNWSNYQWSKYRGQIYSIPEP